jgi:hypothetical protein
VKRCWLWDLLSAVSPIEKTGKWKGSCTLFICIQLEQKKCNFNNSLYPKMIQEFQTH